MSNTIQVNTETLGPLYINVASDATPSISGAGGPDQYSKIIYMEDTVIKDTIIRYSANFAAWVWPASHAAAYALIQADPSHWGYPALGLTADEYCNRDIAISFQPVISAALSLDEPSLFNEILAYCPSVGTFADLTALTTALGVAVTAADAAKTAAELACDGAMAVCEPYTDGYGNTCGCPEPYNCCIGIGDIAWKESMQNFYFTNGLTVVKKHQYIYDDVEPAKL